MEYHTYQWLNKAIIFSILQDMIIYQIVKECLDRGHNSPILARHGIPDEMMTDDMPFNSFTM